MQANPRRFGQNLRLDGFVILAALAFAYWLLRPLWPVGWSADDGTHLWFSAQYPAQRYLADPALLRVATYAHLTPLMNLFYSANLQWFGMDAEKFRLVTLLLALATLAAYYRMLRLWMAPLPAGGGTALLAAGYPFFSVVSTFMTNHYLAGLLFACLAVVGVVQWSRTGRAACLAAGALAYALAMLCKEVYVPALVLFWFLMEGRRRRLGMAVLTGLLLAYLAWRVHVLGSLVGGYRSGVFLTGGEVLRLVRSVGTILDVGFGHVLGLAAVAAATLGLAWLARTGRTWYAAALLLCGATVGPLLPLVSLGIVQQPDRYFLALFALLGAGQTVLAASAFRSGERWRQALAAALMLPLAVLVWVQHHKLVPSQLVELQGQHARYAQSLEQPDNLVLVLPDIRSVSHEIYWSLVINHARRAFALTQGHENYPRTVVLRDLSAPALRGLMAAGVKAYRFDAQDCNCLVPLGPADLPAASTPPSVPAFAKDRVVFGYEPTPGEVPEIVESAWGDSTVDQAVLSPEDPRVVTVRGWIDVAREIDLLYVVLPFRDQVVAELAAQPRPDVARARGQEAYLHSGFELRLSFSSPELAQRALKQMCIAVPAVVRSPFALLRNQPAYCAAFIPAKYRAQP